MKASEQQIGGNHYKEFTIQPTEFIAKNNIGFIEGNVIKYVCRHKAKNGRQDIVKAIHYLQLLLEYEYTTREYTATFTTNPPKTETIVDELFKGSKPIPVHLTGNYLAKWMTENGYIL